MSDFSDQSGGESELDEEFSEHPIYDLCRRKRFDEALEICRAKIATAPEQAWGYRDMASVLMLMGRYQEALPYSDKTVTLAPEHVVSYFCRADLLYKLGRYAAAIADFTLAAKFDRDQLFGAAHFLYRADCHRRLGNYEQALTDCALIPDNFDFPGFFGRWDGGKRHLLAAIERELEEKTEK